MVSPTIATLVLMLASAVLCERTSRPKVIYRCAEKYFRVGNNCYHLSTEKVQWREAVFKCQDINGSLAVLDTKIKDHKLRRSLNRMKQIKGERWIAGEYDNSNHVWRWAHYGEPFKYRGFSMLRRRDNAWKCTAMDHTMKYRWNSRKCFQKKKYICERPMEALVLKEGQQLANSRPASNRTIPPRSRPIPQRNRSIPPQNRTKPSGLPKHVADLQSLCRSLCSNVIN